MSLNREQLTDLTKDWLMTMIYDKPTTFDNLIQYGCKAMIYGHDTYEDILDIVKSLQDTGHIKRIDGKLHLTARGIFSVKKNTLMPLEKLTDDPKYFTSFVAANRSKCDIKFLESLLESKDKTERIQSFSRHHYLDVERIKELISTFLSHYPEFGFGFK